MTTKIISNGSKWAGEEPDSIEVLLDLLTREPLHPMYESFGNFIETNATTQATRFWGNFLGLSHVFQIDSDEPEVIAKLTAAIRLNQASPAYRKWRMVVKRDAAANRLRKAQKLA